MSLRDLCPGIAQLTAGAEWLAPFFQSWMECACDYSIAKKNKPLVVYRLPKGGDLDIPVLASSFPLMLGRNRVGGWGEYTGLSLLQWKNVCRMVTTC